MALGRLTSAPRRKKPALGLALGFVGELAAAIGEIIGDLALHLALARLHHCGDESVEQARLTRRAAFGENKVERGNSRNVSHGAISLQRTIPWRFPFLILPFQFIEIRRAG